MPDSEELNPVKPKPTKKGKGKGSKAKKAQENKNLPEDEILEDFDEEYSEVESSIIQRVNSIQNFQGETSGRESVRRVLTTEYTDSEVMRVVDSIRAAKHSENHVNGQISHKLDFRQALTEVFLFDMGASVSIIGEKVAKEN